MATDPVMIPTRRTEFIAGVKDTLPLVIGATPFAIIFGALAATTLSMNSALAMSGFIFAGSAQFIGINLMATGASAAVIILTTFVVNLRHALYSATLAPHVKHLPQRWLVPLGFWLTDETFVIVISRYNRPDDSPYKHWYFLGSEVFMYTNWFLWTWIGARAGESIKDPQSWGLDFAMVATFIGMLIPFVKNRATRISILVAGITSVLTYNMPNKLGLIVAALLGIASGVLVETRWPDAVKEPTTFGGEMSNQPETQLQEGR
jgi:4-azaleucine resistance transporter AzlC